jgi:hypothetical protein
MILYEIWFGHQFDLFHLKTFGYMAHVLIIMEKKQKLDAHFIECIFLGYGENSKACRLMITSRKQIFVLRKVYFL